MGSSTGDLLVDDESSLDKIIAKISRRASFHAEDEARLIARMNLRKAGDPSSHPVWRDEEAALIATTRFVGLAEKHGKRVHVLHVSTAEEMAFLAGHKDFASVEVTPHHLTLAAPECYERLGTYVQMNPPVRGERHRTAIWAALNSGVVDILGSDHAPHTREEKDHAYPASHSGMTGVQTLVPIMLDHVNAGRLTLQRFVDLTSHGPQRLFGIRGKGRIAVGYDADLTIVDLKRRETITNAGSKAGADGRPMTALRCKAGRLGQSCAGGGPCGTVPFWPSPGRTRAIPRRFRRLVAPLTVLALALQSGPSNPLFVPDQHALVSALQNAIAPTEPMSWAEAFVLSSAATAASLPLIACLYLIKSAAGINFMAGASPLHDLLYWIVA